ncbi:MAG: DUF4288 domain-containing protein [Flavisolibacter sp.]
MKWYLAKMVFQVICGDGDHTAQFDEQLRLIAAEDEDRAFEKAWTIGNKEQECFYNQKKQLVRWQFINVPEMYRLGRLMDGAEIYSRINEVDDGGAYANFIHEKAATLREKQTRPLLKLM